MNRIFVSLLAMLVIGSVVVSARAQVVSGGESLAGWEYLQPVEMPKAIDSQWVDFVLVPSVFSGSRFDLADLRLYNTAGREIPYALRVRRPEFRQDPISAREFNRVRGPEGSDEVSLDLGSESVEHNEVQVKLPGKNYRRRAVLDGSPDANEWRELATDYLLQFRVGDKELEDNRIAYPPNRFRYLRLRVYPDRKDGEVVEGLGEVTVWRRVEVPGEFLTLPGQLGPREPVRTSAAPGSAWVIGLGGESVPCEKLEVTIDDQDFVRDYEIQAGGPEGSQQRFYTVVRGTWQRRAGEKREPLVAEFNEIRASRLKLLVVDHRNPPLDVRAVSYSAPARQVVFPKPKEEKPGIRLYYGNPEAEAPHYDFAGNLPARLQPAPARAELGARQENPVFVSRPLPLTERWPWLIYVVLGIMSLTLAVIIFNVANAAIAAHDAAVQGTAAPAEHGTQDVAEGEDTGRPPPT